MSDALIQHLKLTDQYKDLKDAYIKFVIRKVFDIIIMRLNYAGQVKIKGFGTFKINNYTKSDEQTFYTIKFKPSSILLGKIN